MAYEVQVKEVPVGHVAAIRKRTSKATIGQDISAGFEAIGEATSRAGVPLAGPPFLIMFDVIGEGSEVGDIEIGFPVGVPFAGAAEVVGREEPAMTVAWTMHRGPYEELGPAYEAVTDWIQEHGHEIVGPPREIYLTDPSETPDPADYVTEIRFPIS